MNHCTDDTCLCHMGEIMHRCKTGEIHAAVKKYIGSMPHGYERDALASKWLFFDLMEIPPDAGSSIADLAAIPYDVATELHGDGLAGTGESHGIGDEERSAGVAGAKGVAA